MTWVTRFRGGRADPVVTGEAQLDLRDALLEARADRIDELLAELDQARHREALLVAEFEAETARLRAAAASAVMTSGLAQFFYAGIARRRYRGPDTERTVVYPRLTGRHHAAEAVPTEFHPRVRGRR